MTDLNDPLSGVTLEGIAAYLMTHGWTQIRPWGDWSSIGYRHESGLDGVVVPLDTHAQDYSRRLGNVVRGIARCDALTEDAVVEAIRAATPAASDQPIQVTVHDPVTGETVTRELMDDYVIITAGTCTHRTDADLVTGVHVITVTGRKRGAR